MDEQRFDNFTRILARGVSRRQVLRVAAGSVLGLLVGQRGQEATAATGDCSTCSISDFTCPPAPPTSFACPAISSTKRNEVKGTCDQVLARFSQGVYSGTGYHAGKVGWTDVASRGFSLSSSSLVVGTVKESGQTCYFPQHLKQPPFFATAKIYTLKWILPTNSSPCCQAEHDRWQQAVYDHECRHARDIQAIVAEINTKYTDANISTNPNYKICGGSKSQASKIIGKRLAQDLTADVALFDQQVDCRCVCFHQSPESQISLSCEKCTDCSASGASSSQFFAAAEICCENGPPCGIGCETDCCGKCETCENNACVPKACPDLCQQCNPETGVCEPKSCGACEACNLANGECESTCSWLPDVSKRDVCR